MNDCCQRLRDQAIRCCRVYAWLFWSYQQVWNFSDTYRCPMCNTKLVIKVTISEEPIEFHQEFTSDEEST